MTQDEINSELDQLLGELIFNGDITRETTPYEMKDLLLARAAASGTRIGEEQWLAYTTYCLQGTVESATQKTTDQRKPN